MTVYWLLFALPAILALLFPIAARDRLGIGQTMAVVGFMFVYLVIATARYEIGGDWDNYVEIFEDIRQLPLGEALRNGDPMFSLAMWLSAWLGTGVYLPNGLCAGLIVLGIVRLALRTREPWLALVAAVPYLLIVVGMGYVRQAGAMGLVMMAMAGLDRQRPWLTMAQLALAAGFHATAGAVFPLFALAVARRNMALAGIMGLAVAAFAGVMVERLDLFQTNYLEAQYDSDGSTVRIAMNALPAAFLLLRWRHFDIEGAERRMWLLVALVNIASVVALVLSPSSTAVDRIALYFAPIQLLVAGNVRELAGFGPRSAMVLRAVVIGAAALVQVVWLMLATYASAWVPYRSVLDLL